MSEIPVKSTARKRASPRRRTRLRHGFYSRSFRPVELEDLAVLEANLEDEIAGLRVASRRILELAETLEDPQDGIRALAAFGANLMRVARLLKLHSELKGPENSTLSEINKAIRLVLKEKQKA